MRIIDIDDNRFVKVGFSTVRELQILEPVEEKAVHSLLTRVLEKVALQPTGVEESLKTVVVTSRRTTVQRVSEILKNHR